MSAEQAGPAEKSSSPAVDLRGASLARSAGINFVGMAVPYLVGFITIPLIIHRLGSERFGILSLIWVVIGYFAFIDLGLGRATTKYVAQSLGRGELDHIPHYVWTTVFMQCLLGLVGAVFFVCLTPVLVEHILKIQPQFIGEAKTAFIIMGLALPIILLSSLFRGVLEAAQRFDLVNVIKIPVSISFYVLPLIGWLLKMRLPGIVILMVAARAASLAAWLFFCLKVLPVLRSRIVFHRATVKTLISFGGWVSLSSILFTVTNSADRFLIGSLLSVTDVTYYSAPLEVVMRFGIIPGSLSLILFPTFSSLAGSKAEDRSKELFARSVKYVFLGVGPLVLLFAFYARPFLRLWLGPEFAQRSTLVFQILAVGFLLTSLSAVPFNFLQGTGRVALATKLQILELGIYLPLAWIFIKRWGIVGAALSLTLKSVVITFLYFFFSGKLRKVEWRAFSEAYVIRAVISIALMALVLFIVSFLRLKLVGLILETAFILALGYFYVLRNDEKSILVLTARKLFP